MIPRSVGSEGPAPQVRIACAIIDGVDARHAAITFESVSFAYPGRSPVLQDISFSIPPGVSAALVGASGVGKSTLLKLINRLLDPETGCVAVDGRDTRTWDRYVLRRHIGYVLQDVGLFPHQTVEQNVGLVPWLLHWPHARIQDRTRELLTLVGLSPDEFATRWPDELSGGQRQRVGVARALAADPPILLMDEPFGALDPLTRRDLQREFLRIQQRLRKTVVLVTHDMAEARLLADWLGVLDEGALVAWDRAERVAASRDPRVQPFFESPSQTLGTP
ncbi:MAG: ATP-binding cassette domain-containing protein [Luteitalea sp.]|nr:ATP-binding cassette domain-containing protein [Luteitalea sp.]